MIKAVLFDMDGLLIDSEPFWREAEIYSFGKLGIHLTEEMCILTMGRKLEEVIQYWFDKHPWENKSLKDLESEILEGVKSLIMKKGMPMVGVDYIINFFESKGLKIGLASSSASQLIDTVLNKLGIKEHFLVAHSAEFEKRGKPEPDVFLTAAKKLGVSPTECLVFEDSYFGLLAAKAAKMKSIAIPDKAVFGDQKFNIADIKLNTLLEFNQDHLDYLNTSPTLSV